MSYASCLNNRFSGEQYIENLSVNNLTVTNLTSNKTLSSRAIPDNTIQNDTLTVFFSEVLPVGSYNIIGTVAIQPTDGDATSNGFSVFESSTSIRFPLNQLTFASSELGGLIGPQAIPFNTLFTSDGMKPLEFSIYLYGGSSFQIIQGQKSIQWYSI